MGFGIQLPPQVPLEASRGEVASIIYSSKNFLSETLELKVPLRES